MKAVVKSNAGLTVEVRNLVAVSVLDLISCAQTGESKVPPVLAIYLAVRTFLTFGCIFISFLMCIITAEQKYQPGSVRMMFWLKLHLVQPTRAPAVTPPCSMLLAKFVYSLAWPVCHPLILF